MDDTTITNMLNIGTMIENPFSMLQIKNIKEDMGMFSELAEVAGDLSACHFAQSAKDLRSMCTEKEDACKMETIT